MKKNNLLNKRLLQLDKKYKEYICNLKTNKSLVYLTNDEIKEYDFLKFISCFKNNESIPFISPNGILEDVEFYISKRKVINHKDGTSTYIDRKSENVNIEYFLYDDIVKDGNFYKKVVRDNNFIFPHHYKIKYY